MHGMHMAVYNQFGLAMHSCTTCNQPKLSSCRWPGLSLDGSKMLKASECLFVYSANARLAGGVRKRVASGVSG
jgi:hypothetical protein